MSIREVDGAVPLDPNTFLGNLRPGARALHKDVIAAIEKLQYAVACHHNAELEAINLIGFGVRPRETHVSYIGDVHVFFTSNPEVG